VGAAAAVDFEDPRDDGNSAQGIPVDCSESQVCRGELPGK